MTVEKETCNTLEGLFETLSNKFKPQYNETIKSLQFRKLYRYNDENVEESMGRMCIAAVECNYQEVDRQLKEQFIHGLNNKYMLEEIIKELTATKNYAHITSGGILAWAKRVEVQSSQAAVLNILTESKQFDQIKMSKKAKDDKTRAPIHQITQQQPCRYCGRVHKPRQCSAFHKMCVECGKVGHFQKSCHSRRSRVVNEMEQEVSQEYKEDNIETVSVNSVCMNKNQSMLTTKLDTYADNNNMIILYKIDKGSECNIMPWYIFKKLFPKVTEAELMKTIENHIKLKTFNKTFITQLGMCAVIINYKNNKKKCEFFVVPRNG